MGTLGSCRWDTLRGHQRGLCSAGGARRLQSTTACPPRPCRGVAPMVSSAGQTSMLGGRKGRWLTVLAQPSLLALRNASGSEPQRSLCSSLGAIPGGTEVKLHVGAGGGRREEECAGHSGRGECVWTWGAGGGRSC